MSDVMHVEITYGKDCSPAVKGVTAKMSLSLSIFVHTLVMASLKPRVKVFKEENDSNTLTLGPSLGDAINQGVARD